MLFHSLQFLVFLPIVFAGYWWVFCGQRARLVFLLLASYVFYMSWNPKLILLLWGSTTIDYFAVKFMGRTEDQRVRRALLAVSIIFNLSVLAVFKYANFFLQSVGGVGALAGHPLSIPHLDIVLPLGISFYTFETISYTIDGYLRKNPPCKNFTDYAFFISFFPHLIAGPIVRPKQFLPQLEGEKNLTQENISVGLSYFLFGLIKKVLIADRLAVFADPIFASPSAYGSAAVWLGLLAYAMQIYCDFSGYSSMAIGLARLFDFQLPVNFRTPYLSCDVSEFWRRWHISLSTWLRDYLYSPLRGESKSEGRVLRSVLLTMAIGGLWHGANWTFVVWGCYHGVLLIGHRLLSRSWKGAPPRWLSQALVFLLVCVGWVFFRAQSLGEAMTILHRMALPTAGGGEVPLAIMGLIALVFCMDAVEYWAEDAGFDIEQAVIDSPALLRLAGYAAAIFLLVTLAPMQVKAFIYFQF